MLELIEDYDGPEEEDEVSKGFNTLFMKVSIYPLFRCFFSNFKIYNFWHNECSDLSRPEDYRQKDIFTYQDT